MAINVTIQDADSGVDVTVAGGANRTNEEIEDVVNALLSQGNSVTLTYDDANDDLEVAVNESELSFYDGTDLTGDVNNSSVTTGSVAIGGVRTMEHLETVNKTTDSSAFDIDLSGYDYDFFILDGVLQDGTQGTTDALQFRFNDINTADYNWANPSDGRTVDAAQINARMFLSSNQQTQAVIHFGVDPNTSGGNSTPSLYVREYSPNTTRIVHIGGLKQDISDINKLNVVTGPTEQFKMELYGISEVGTA